MQTNHTEAVLETLLRAIAMSSLPQKGKDDIVVFFSSAGIQRLTDVIPFGLELDNYSGVASEAGLMRLTLALMEQLPGLDDELEKAKAILMASSLPSPVEALNMLREALIDHMLQVARSSEDALRDMLRNGIESFDNYLKGGR